MRFRFRREARVRASAEFDLVFKQGRRTATPLLSLHWHPDDVPARLGLAVSRKVDRRAVGRNRIKRTLRDAFRHVRGELPPGRYVLVARPPASAADNVTLRATLLATLRRAGALPPMAAPGTMPGASPSPRTAPAPSGE